MWSRPKRLRLFASARHRPRARRATDVVLLVLAVAGIALCVAAAHPPSGFESALIEMAASVPSAFDVVWKLLAGAQLGWAVLLVVLTLVRWRPTVVRDLLLAAIGAGILAVAVDELWLGGTTGGLADALWSLGPPAQAVSVRLAVVVATTVVASPDLTRPFRKLSRGLVLGGGVSLVILGATTPTGAAIGVLCGTISAAVVHLLLGSSAGQPSTREVADALAELGLDGAELHEAESGTAGVFRFETVDADGNALLVKVYGRDAWDSQLVAKVWRSLWYREADAPTLTRVQQAEHEAFVTLLAERAGVPVEHVVSAGIDASNDALIVLRRPGGREVGLSEFEGRPDGLTQVWDTVESLHRAGIAHRDLAPARFSYDGTRVVVSGFEGAVVSPTGDQRNSDQAQLLVTSVLLGGVDDTMAMASDRLGPEGVGAVIPYLQIPALGATLRADVQDADVDLDDVRGAAAAAAGTEVPALAKLRRVSRSALFQAVLLTVGAYFLISSLSGIDFAQVWEQVQDAVWGLLLVALLLGQSPRFAQAESARGACPRLIAYGPLALLQFAITFINLVLPSTAARVATNVRFFQRQGIPAASAMSIGVIDSLGGFAVQIMILCGVLLFGWGDVQLEMPSDSALGEGNLLTVLVAVAVIVIVGAIVSLLFPGVRRRVKAFVAPHVAEVRDTVGNLRSPAKVAQVIGGNLAAEFLFACTLAIVLSAFHSPVPIGTLLVINVCVSLFAGLMPVPGGIGVTEGALIFGLTAAGVDEATAFAATMCYRLITFYLPPIWGAVVFRHMEQTGML
jgi:uncharacterized membrane protein YbhN (UPF0104 family)/tRNA A-37 threonylcarbamoyl transferase component Bud32